MTQSTTRFTFNPTHLDDLSDLTLVIFTRNRRRFVCRQLSLWRNTNVRIAIFDNGASLDESLSDKCRELGYHYQHAAGAFANQMATAKDFVCTPFAMMLDDDNFVLKRSLSLALMRIRSEPALGAVRSRVCTISPADGVINFRGVYHPRGVNSDPDRSALASHFIPYRQSNWYSIQRRHIFGASTELAGRVLKQSSSGYAAEILVEAFLSATVSIGDCDNLLLLRSTENAPLEAPEVNRVLRFSEWWLSHDYSNEVRECMSLLLSAMQDQGIHDEQDVWRVLTEYAHDSAGLSSDGARHRLSLKIARKVGIESALRKIRDLHRATLFPKAERATRFSKTFASKSGEQIQLKFYFGDEGFGVPQIELSDLYEVVDACSKDVLDANHCLRPLA